MTIIKNSFWIQKDGNDQAEYEDAYWPDLEEEYTDECVCFAVADGASEGFLSGEWAKILVKEFCNSEVSTEDPDLFIFQARNSWESWIKGYLQKREIENRPIQWFEEPGLSAGAFSTFLGLRIYNNSDQQTLQWKAYAVGDTCIFHVHEDTLIRSFPIESANAFNSWPSLISTNNIIAGKNEPVSELKMIEGVFNSGDCFYIMTDALSAWFLREYENNKQPWVILRDLDTQEIPDFHKWIKLLWQTNELRNDDITLLRIEID